MKRYFSECRTAEELKKEYRQLAKKLHPDAGGDEEEFKKMQGEFSEAWDRLRYVHFDREGREYTKDTEETAEEFINIIDELLRLKGVEVEICGAWIWCSGNTKPYRDVFKRLKFKWATKKCAWYYHKEPYKKRGNREMSLDEIREMYGSKKYKTQEQNELEPLMP